MSQIEPPASEESGGREGRTREITLDGTKRSITLPNDASIEEAAAIAVAVGAHLTDRQRAAMAAAARREATERVDQWLLASRMRKHGRRHWPRDVERGDEWRAAARSF